MEDIETVERRLAEQSKAAGRLFSTPDGLLVLQALERMYVYGDLIAATEHRTYMNLGAREVVLYLRDLRDAGNRGA